MNLVSPRFLTPEIFRLKNKKFRSLEELKGSGYLSVDFYLSKSCNRSCHYCTAWTKEMRNLTVDMDFLRQTLKYISPFKTRVCLLGGEPALIKNLEEVISEVKKHKNLVIQVLSNSLIRKQYPWVLQDPDIFYIEHLVLDFYEDRIEKLGPFDFLEPNDLNNYNLIIKTPNYYKYRNNFDLKSLLHKNTEFKDYNSRSPTYSATEQAPEIDRRMCAKFPMVPVIDFELKKIRHCSRRVDHGSRQFEASKKNITAMMKFDLFEYEEYCKLCMDAISQRPEVISSKIRRKI